MVQFCSCFKKGPDNCEEIQQIKIVGAKNEYFIGDQIDLEVNKRASLAFYRWWLGDNPNGISLAPELSIGPCEKKDEGMYHIVVSYQDCATKIDSVFISVKNRPVTAPCNPDNNTVVFSAIPDIGFSSVTLAIDNVFGRKNLRGRTSTGNPDLNIYFNMFWDKKDPEDGAYFIDGTASLFNYSPYTVYMSSKYTDILFSATGGKIYVSHVNGKLQVKFCDINLQGTFGSNIYKTTATGTITAP